jgi:thiamine biosynthesis protein ThiI
MKYIVKLAPEIAIKSKVIRKKFTNLLKKNLGKALRKYDEEVVVLSDWDKILIETSKEDSETESQIQKKLARVSGVYSFAKYESFPLVDFEDCLKKVSLHYAELLEGKSFCVRVKRAGEHDFRSIDLEKYLGGGLLRRTGALKVQLKNPEVTVNIEVKEDKFYILTEKKKGINGFPLGTQGKVLSLISGGFDSGVSSFLSIKKGCKTDFLFFNLGGTSHELAVKEMAKYINDEYSDGYKSNFIAVNFEEIMRNLIEETNHKYRAILLKRLMLKAANFIAKEHGYEALITGENLGQVSSQTLTNLAVITEAAETLIMRPLISLNKEEIIKTAETIGTAKFSEQIPEFCGAVSDKPATAAKLENVLEEEAKFDMSLISEALIERKVTKSSDFNKESVKNQVITSSFLEKNDIVIDIREEKEAKAKPLLLEKNELLKIPFTKLKTEAKKLKKEKNYLLYCSSGTLSKSQAESLNLEGHQNIKVYTPLKKVCLLKK